MPDQAPNQPFDLFISYNSHDHEWVRVAKSSLKERGIRSFLDRDDLPKGHPWPRALEEALNSAGAVAVFVGPNGFGNWQMREMWYALDLQTKLEQQGRFFPVIP